LIDHTLACAVQATDLAAGLDVHDASSGEHVLCTLVLPEQALELLQPFIIRWVLLCTSDVVLTPPWLLLDTVNIDSNQMSALIVHRSHQEAEHIPYRCLLLPLSCWSTMVPWIICMPWKLTDLLPL
jgi:hypothetical protein